MNQTVKKSQKSEIRYKMFVELRTKKNPKMPIIVVETKNGSKP